MNYANIIYQDIANGLGLRTTLFVSGCRRRCPGCFNEKAWDFHAGKPFTKKVENDILNNIKPYIDGLTILGGEPMEPENQKELLPFLKRFKKIYPSKTIWLYTSATYEELQDKNNVYYTNETSELLSLIDVLVDGPFILNQRNLKLTYRGSENQRLIDMNETRKQGKIIPLIIQDSTQTFL